MMQDPSPSHSKPPRRSFWSIALAVVAIGSSVVGCVGALALSGSLLEVFEEFGVDLSRFTLFTLGYWVPALLGMTLALSLLLEFLHLFLADIRPVLNAIHAAVLLIGLFCLAVYVAGVLPSVWALMNGLAA